MIAFETSLFAKKMPHLVVPTRLFCFCWGKHTISSMSEIKPTPTTIQKNPPSPTTQNTHSHTTHTRYCSPPTRRHAQTRVTNMHTHTNRRAVTDFFDGPSCVENIVVTVGLALKRQCFGKHYDLVSVRFFFSRRKGVGSSTLTSLTV